MQQVRLFATISSNADARPHRPTIGSVRRRGDSALARARLAQQARSSTARCPDGAPSAGAEVRRATVRSLSLRTNCDHCPCRASPAAGASPNRPFWAQIRAARGHEIGDPVSVTNACARTRGYPGQLRLRKHSPHVRTRVRPCLRIRVQALARAAICACAQQGNGHT